MGQAWVAKQEEERARRGERLSPAEWVMHSCILCLFVPLQWWVQWCPLRVDSGGMVSCNCRCLALRGQPANARDDYAKRPSSPAWCLASLPLVTPLHKIPVAFTQRRRDSSRERDVSWERGCVTTQRGLLGCIVKLSVTSCVLNICSQGKKH